MTYRVPEAAQLKLFYLKVVQNKRIRSTFGAVEMKNAFWPGF